MTATSNITSASRESPKKKDLYEKASIINPNKTPYKYTVLQLLICLERSISTIHTKSVPYKITPKGFTKASTFLKERIAEINVPNVTRNK